MNWRELGKKLQELPRDFDTSKISKGKDLADPLKETFLSVVSELDEKEIYYLRKSDIKSKDLLLKDLAAQIDKVNYCISRANPLEDDVNPNLDKILFKTTGDCDLKSEYCYLLPTGSHLYRMRNVVGEYKRFKKEGLYSVCEKDCKVISHARFNTGGVSLLYLAESLYTAWEEMSRPDFHRVNFVRFETTRELKVLDLTVPDVPDSINSLVRAYMAVACGMKVKDNEAYNWEYEFSNLISNRVYNRIRAGKTSIVGIRYHSTRRFEDDFNIDNSDISISYAFIPQDTTHPSGYCPKLAGKFKMTEPSSYFFLKVHRQKFVPADKPNTSEYQHTIFAELEEILKSQETTPCTDLL